jgi:RNA polymerase sigma factor (sigma-70 family)
MASKDPRLLTRKEEIELSITVRKGIEARDKLINSNRGLVVSIAKKYAGDSSELSDFIQEGNLALFRAAELFDPSFDARFSTYATWWIKTKIARAKEKKGKEISLNAKRKLEDGEDSDGDLYSFLPDENAVAPETTAARNSMRRLFKKSFATLLPPNERMVLLLRFGLEDGIEHTLQEIATLMGVTRETIRRIEKRALEKLKTDWRLKRANEASQEK